MATPRKSSSGTTRRRAAAKTAPKKQAVQPDEGADVEVSDEIPEFKGLHHRILWVQNQVPQVDKTGKVDFTGKSGRKTKYDFIQEHGVFQALRALMRAAGLGSICSFPPDQANRNGNHVMLGLVLTVFDEDGNTITAEYRCEGVDDGDKASYKAETAGHKYALQKFFKVPTEAIDDADTNASDEAPAKRETTPKGPNTIPQKRAADIHKIVQSASDEGVIDANRVLAKLQGEYDVTKISELTADQATDFEKWFAEQVAGASS